MNPKATSDLPNFAAVKGNLSNSLPLKPPFTITDLSTRVFSLRSKLDVTQGFLDNYLNIIPPELGRFRAFSPYVMLMVMDYGGLALEVTNTGWFSQHEVMFGIPVEWYKVVNGRWMFHDWAVIPAYIFVDDDLSLPMGRTVVGWPKTKVQVGQTASRIERDPREPQLETVLSANVFPELYAGKKLQNRVFLEVERTAPYSTGFPLNPGNPIMPWTVWGKLVESMVDMSRDSVQWMKGLGLVPTNPGTSSQKYATMLQLMRQKTNPLRPDLGAKVLNLKQFRASDDPSKYCYQALTVGSMAVTKVNGFGILGQESRMAGDISGGYRIRIFDWPSLPIVRSLGLEVERTTRGDGVDVAELQPLFPFWYDVDMEYGLGYDLAWRSHKGIWHGLDGKTYPPENPATDFLYNTSLGPATRPLAGPFRFTGTTVRVLPLMAHRAVLQGFLDNYINAALQSGRHPKETPKERFIVWGPSEPDYPYAFVYLTASSFTGVTSGTNNVGDAAERQLEYLIPVRRERFAGLDDDGNEVWDFIGVGLIPPFSYTENVTSSIATREVLGIPSNAATFQETESTWMSELGPSIDSEQPLLGVEAEVLPAIGEGSEAVVRPIVHIASGTTRDAGDFLFWRNLGDDWGRAVRAEVERKKAKHKHDTENLRTARALALELLGNAVPFSIYTLKQFRSNEEPDNACYQSLVKIHRTLAEVKDLREIEEPLLVTMHDFPMRSLVKTLGLIAQPVTGNKLGIVYGLKPIRPFWARVTMDEALGQRMRSRAGSSTWEPGPEEDSYFDPSRTIPVGEAASTLLDQGDPRRMFKAAADWAAAAESGWQQWQRAGKAEGEPERRDTTKRRRTGPVDRRFDAELRAKGEERRLAEEVRRRAWVERRRITVDQAEQAVTHIDPQTIIESIISREWGNWDPNNRWRTARRALEERYERTMSGARGKLIPAAERLFFEDVLHEARHAPGVLLPDETLEKTLLDRLHRFTTERIRLEESWGVLVTHGLGALYPSAVLADGEPPPKQIGKGVTSLTHLTAPIPKIAQAMVEMLTTIQRIEGLDIKGGTTSPDRDNEASKQDNRASLQRLVRHTVEPLLEKLESLEHAKDGFDEVDRAVRLHRDKLREVEALAHHRCILQREAVLNYAAKGYQKPDYCIRRDVAGPEMERLFPVAESWDRTWYAGPDILDEQEKDPDTDTDTESPAS